MNISRQHHNIIQSELSEIAKRHQLKVLAFTPKLVAGSFEPNGSVYKPYVKDVKENATEQFKMFVAELEEKIFDLLNKMEIKSFKEKDKNILITFLQNQFKIETYERSMSSILPNVESKCSSYGIVLGEHEKNTYSRQIQLNQALLCSHVHTMWKDFVCHLDNEFSIYVLKHKSKGSTDDNIIDPTISVMGVKVRMHKIYEKIKRFRKA